MDENVRFEQLEALRKAAWESIANRRQYEWRICIAFWTLLLAIIVGFGAGQVRSFAPRDRGWEIAFHVIASVVPLLLASVHTWWLFGVHRAYRLDKREESDLREAMRDIAGFREAGKVTVWRSEAILSGSGQAFAQGGMTWVLTALAVLTILFHLVPASRRAPEKSATQSSGGARSLQMACNHPRMIALPCGSSSFALSNAIAADTLPWTPLPHDRRNF